MVRSIVTGNLSAECGTRNAEFVYSNDAFDGRSSGFKFRIPRSAFRTQKGFSLLELMIAMFILIILLSVAFPTYQRSVQHARETVLKENLWQMRRAIDQFQSDKQKLPKSIDELVEMKYLREKPIDPITEKDDWEEVQGEDELTPDGEMGMKDVKSGAPGVDSDGKEYKEY